VPSLRLIGATLYDQDILTGNYWNGNHLLLAFSFLVGGKVYMALLISRFQYANIHNESIC